MNKLWIRLTLAFFGITTATVVLTFSFFFAFSWLAPVPFTQEEYLLDYDDVVQPYVETYIVEGKSDEEILTLLAIEPQIRDLLREKRADGYAPNIDLEDRGFGRILGDYLYELSSPAVLQTILIGTLIGMIASIIASRQLTRPLANLTQASHALGQNDLSQRVAVEGSAEVNRLATTFNEMASQLEHAEQVRQSMLADVSHELRTPLAGLEGTLRATLDGVFELTPQHVSNLHEQTRHLTRLVDDLHLLARAEAKRLSLNKTAVSPPTLLNDLADTFAILAQNESVHFIRNLNPTPDINADAGRLRQIISNLLNNALRHTPATGTITLTLQAQANQIEISVQDTGEGIAAEHLPHLFDRFYRADRSRSRETGGTGLGLAITKALVEAHGGTISVASEGERQGSCFAVTLPAA
ncbi:MAG: ATP-binding protein [Chloroflexota bacterium]